MMMMMVIRYNTILCK